MGGADLTVIQSVRRPRGMTRCSGPDVAECYRGETCGRTWRGVCDRLCTHPASNTGELAGEGAATGSRRAQNVIAAVMSKWRGGGG
jgi:hypothetical protein